MKKRALGFKVADFVETTEFLTGVWIDYVEGRCSIYKVIEEYQKHGFQANQDVPGNAYWEELFHASPNSKVIVTIRDSPKDWVRSVTNFQIQEARRMGNPGFWLFQRMRSSGWLSPRVSKVFDLIEVSLLKRIEFTVQI